MRRIVLFLAVLLMTVPVMAASNVTITCVNDVNMVTVSYDSDANLIRAFGLNITVDTANITKLEAVDANYRIYPGQIVIVGGEVTDYNTPYAPDDLGDANVTIEMGSLYTFDSNYADDPNAGYEMQPGTSGTLLKFYVDNDCNYTVAVEPNRGGVVMENPDETPSLDVPLCSGHVTLPPDECMKATHPDYTNWLYWNKPDCWCYPRQCRGDADGLKEGGVFWVSLNDLIFFRTCVDKLEFQLPPGSECADFDRQKEGGVFWVSLNDLIIFRQYVDKLEFQIPECDDTHINFWCSPAGCPP